MAPTPVRSALIRAASVNSGFLPAAVYTPNSMTPVVELDSVSKLYGSFVALRKVSLSIEQGRCYVLLGENGAGKSTLLRLMAGLLRPTYGSVKVFGEKPADVRERIGYMSHASMLYDEFSGAENLRYFAGLYKERECMAPRSGAAVGGAGCIARTACGAVFAGNAAAGIAGARAARTTGAAAA